MDRQATNSTTARFNFQPTVPPPVSTPPAAPEIPISRSQSGLTPSSSSKRFSFSRLFSNSGASSVSHSKSNSLVLAPAITSIPSAEKTIPPPVTTNLVDSTNQLSSSPSWNQPSASLPPPVPHVFPTEQTPERSSSPVPESSDRPVSQEPESPIVNHHTTLPDTSRAVSRQDSIASRAGRRAETESIGFTSGVEDGASFVSAREANTTEGGESDFEVLDRDPDDEQEELTATIPDYGRSQGMEKQKSEGEKTVGKPDGDESVDEGYVVDEEETPVPKTRSAGSSTPSAGTAATPQPPPVLPVFNNNPSPAQPQRALAPSSPSSEVKEKRGRKFGIASLLRNKRSRTQSSNSSPSTPVGAVPSSRQVPATTTTTQADFVAHMAIPTSLIWPQGQGSTSESDYPLSQSRSGAPVTLQKGGVEWPFQSDVEFDQGPDFEMLKWGGFEADVVGVRRTIFSVVSFSVLR